MTQPIVRPATPPDLQHLLAMVKALATHHGDAPLIEAADLERDVFGAHPWLTVLVAEGKETLIGYAALCPLAQLQFGVRGMDMHHLFVEEAYRGRAIGSALITASIQEAKRQGCRYLTVGTHPENTQAQAIYQGAGFDALPSSGPRFRMKF